MKARPAYVADQFYPGDAEELRAMVEGYVNAADVTPAPENVAAVIVPHAGYIYSGATAGYGYKRIRGATPARVVLMGVSHRYHFGGISLYDGDAFNSPLASVMVDRAFCDLLATQFPCEEARPHEYEHTLETQLAFIQVALGNVPIAPMLFGRRAGDEHIAFGAKLAGLLEPGDLVIASTDLSHFLSEKEANRTDKNTIERILAADFDRLIPELRDETCSACGAAAVVTALACANARGAVNRKLLDYRTSAAVSVSYTHLTLPTKRIV